MHTSIDNNLAVITGCSSGIGLKTTEMLLEKGGKVAGWSRRDPEINHPNFKWFETDVTSLENVEASTAATIAHFKQEVSYLINNAGYGVFANLHEMKVEDFDGMFKVNVNGVFYCSRTTIPSIIKAGGGHIINISSVAGLQSGPMRSAYSGTKFAVKAMSDAMFQELRTYDIKVSCIFPGSCKTHFFDDVEGFETHDNMMKPEEIADTILWLLQTPARFLVSDVVVRPLRPKG